MNESGPFKGKVYVPRNIEGEPNTEVLEQIREVENDLSSTPVFVGLAPVGSTMRGYSTESSGINTIIFYDAKPGEEDVKARQDLTRIMDASKEDFHANGKRDVDMSFLNINPETVINPFLENTQNSISEAKFIESIAEMSLLVMGEKIKNYRQIYADEFEKLPPVKQVSIIEQAAIFCEDKERPGTEIGEKRLHPDKSVSEIMEIRKTRRDMWKRRIADMWLKNEDARRHFNTRIGQ